RTQQIEHALRKGKTLAVLQVGGIDLDIGALMQWNVLEALALENGAVVKLHRHFGAIKTGKQTAPPIHRIEQLADQRTLNTATQEYLFIILEEPVTEQAIVGGGKAATGHRGNRVRLIEQSHAL